MTKLVLVLSMLMLKLLAQPRSAGGVFRPVDPALFNNCGQVESGARQLAREIPDRVFIMELYPRGQTLYFPFPSEFRRTPLAVNWLTSYHPQTSPYAMFYSVDGEYTFRCRDEQNKFVETSGSHGDTLQLTLSTGKAVIWHFDMTPEKMAHVFVVTATPLENINGEELMAEVKKQLGARFMFLYARNDPWFLGYSYDTLPYIFTDSDRKISAEEYRKTRTMVCYTDTRCGVGFSQE
jgi:hypothetical protein